MKKTLFLLVLPLLLTSCSSKTYSLKEITGFEVSNITRMQVSSSVYQSLAWDVSEKYYSYLDCKYVLVNFNIDEEFFAWPSNKQKDDAICIHVETEPHFAYSMPYSAIFYISHKSHYMYIQVDEEKSMRSMNKMSNSFIMEITTWN